MPAAASSSTKVIHISSRHSLPRQAQPPKRQLHSRNLSAIASPKLVPHCLELQATGELLGNKRFVIALPHSFRFGRYASRILLVPAGHTRRIGFYTNSFDHTF